MANNRHITIDDVDKRPPLPPRSPHAIISGADFDRAQSAPIVAYVPPVAWIVLGVLVALFGGVLLYWLTQALRRWSESSPLAAWLSLFLPVAAVGALGCIFLYWLAGKAYYSIARSRATAYQAMLVRLRMGTPVAADQVATAPMPYLLGQEQAANALELGRAPFTKYPVLASLSEGNHDEAHTNINALAEEDAPALPPSIVTLDSFPPSDSPTAVPLGMDGADPIRLDFGGDTLHVGLYGASGAGKDNLLRAWFMTLTRRNTPDALCFAVLDGKGDWLTADLKDLAHMWMPPAGGAGQAGSARMKAGIERIEAEMVRRLDLVNAAGCRTREAYMQRTGQGLPLLVVFITDGVTAVEGALTGLMNDLVSKARAVGIRVVVSMQTPTGQDMRWRLNLSTYISGHLPHPSQDLVALGLKSGELAIRPSQLPTPQQEPGVFIVRQGEMVRKVKAVFVRDEAFDGYVARLARRAVPVVDDQERRKAEVKAKIAALSPEQRLIELRKALALRGNTRTGYRYTTDYLREMFAIDQRVLIALSQEVRGGKTNGVSVE